ncbi:MAG: ribokinase [Acidimicrobiaceae bacterium]|jgi:ribokinase|nr:ribokinase [Acidimicrobiaceae bacterium]MDQ1369092.1 ribokinase [Acidimicrobiaceae bacterium]MDQ1376807.1 ribokinase [Acidimicrobiaceae bacterium]MDQ1401471.1 ribokinase [Acidimicrobiaceae bacterium]MDQ1415630.1 ribokinase [Acidimicrobiaceae bacterium]
MVVGSINMDVVARAPRHPAVGETLLGTALSFVPGGKGANQAVAAARLAAPTELVGRVGADAFGDSLLGFLTDERVGTGGVQRLPDVATGVAIIVVDEGGDNTIVVVPGANHAMTPADVDSLPIEADDIVVVQYELPLEVVYAALSRARRNGARTILNPAPAQTSPPELLRLADFVVVNEGELAFFTGGGDIRALRQRPDQVVVATIGPGGAIALIGSDVVEVPGRDVPVVDTTGAGDCFVGALAAALSSWAEVDEAVHFANMAASLAVQRPGAGTGMPTLADVEALG